MRSKANSIYYRIFLTIVAAFFILSCGGGGGGSDGQRSGNNSNLPADIDVIEDGLISREGKEVLLTHRIDDDGYSWFVAGNREGEAVGAIYENEQTHTGSRPCAAAYTLPGGEGGFTIYFNDKGLPDKVYFSDRYSATFNSYTDTNHSITVFDEN